MKRKFILLAGLVLILSLAVISSEYFTVTHKNGPLPPRALPLEPENIQGVNIKKHFGNATLTIEAAILKTRVFMPASFLTSILSEDAHYSLRLRNVKFHLTENAKELSIEGPDALANAEFSALTIRSQSILSHKGYTIGPNAPYVHIKISGNKVKVYS